MDLFDHMSVVSDNRTPLLGQSLVKCWFDVAKFKCKCLWLVPILNAHSLYDGRTRQIYLTRQHS